MATLHEQTALDWAVECAILSGVSALEIGISSQAENPAKESLGHIGHFIVPLAA